MPQVSVIGRRPTLAEIHAINVNDVAYWPFDGNALDSHATATHLTVTSGETFSHAHLAPGLNGAWIGGNPERRAFDKITADASLRLNGNFTISCVFNQERSQTPATTDGIVLFELSASTESTNSASSGFGAGTRYALCIEDQGYVIAVLSNGAGAAEVLRSSNEARVVDGVPNHIVLRRSGTTVEVYVNGIKLGTSTATASTGNGTGNNVVVGRSLGTSRLFNGGVACLGVWSVALSAAEITKLYKLHLVKGTRGDLAGGTDIDFQGASTELFDTLTANRTLTFSNPVQGEVIFLQLTQDATGGRTLTLPGSAKVIAGTFSTTASAVNHVGIYCVDEAAPKYIVTYRQE